MEGVILDANCMSHVFSTTDSLHHEFTGIHNWLFNQKGFLVYGGTKYLEELAKTKKYAKIFSLLRQINKAKPCNLQKVDAEYDRIRRLMPNPDFDDPQLAAIVSVSHCKVICTRDTRSLEYIKNANLYPKGVKAPKYHQGNKQNSLLTPEYVENGIKLKKDIAESIKNKIDDLLA